ncbi:MAG: heme-binding protein [Betaproteobacteria bacterium]
MKQIFTLAFVAALGASGQGIAATPVEATVTFKMLTPETALKAAQAALNKCRKDGFQAAVAVVDRSGVVQVLLRDRFAGAHTPDTALSKAWTAASFRQSTGALAVETQPGKTMSGIRNLPRVTAVGGGLPIEAGGSLFGAIAVSGAPGGDADESCANAGIKAIAEDIEF